MSGAVGASGIENRQLSRRSLGIQERILRQFDGQPGGICPCDLAMAATPHAAARTSAAECGCNESLCCCCSDGPFCASRPFSYACSILPGTEISGRKPPDLAILNYGRASVKDSFSDIFSESPSRFVIRRSGRPLSVRIRSTSRSRSFLSSRA